MRKYINLLLIIFVGSLMGCNYLDEKPYDWIDEDDVFGLEISYQKPLFQTYSYIRSGFNNVGGAFLDAATDDGSMTNTSSSIHKVAQGYVTAANPIINAWNNAYKGIRQALYSQKYYEETNIFLQGKTPEEIEVEKISLKAELNALRALFEFDLLCFYGGYVILDEFYDYDDPVLNEKTRSSFEECVNHIVELCDAAAEVLDYSADPGRMTKGAAMAIKAKTLVYAASPLYNDSGNNNPLVGYVGGDVQQRWKDAAEACAEVINLKDESGKLVYSLNKTNNYEDMFVNDVPLTEYIVFAGGKPTNQLERRQFPPTIAQGSGGGTVPSQQLVDAFTMADGSDFVVGTDNNPKYKDRDPRFKAIIGYNDSKYGNRTIYTHVGERSTQDGLNVMADRSTNTGYYLIKFVKRGMNLSVGNPVSQRVWPIIRLSDMLLLYAEALTNGYGIDQSPFVGGEIGLDLTALGAVGLVRGRAFGNAADSFLDNVTTPQQLMAKIEQERRVELCFEEQRYFDLRRWKKGDKLATPIKGVRITGEENSYIYNYFTVDGSRHFRTKMYFHPIPTEALRKGKGLVQNPGW